MYILPYIINAGVDIFALLQAHLECGALTYFAQARVLSDSQEND